MTCKLTIGDLEKLSDAARTALGGFIPEATLLDPHLPNAVTVVSGPLSTGQRGEVSIEIHPLVEIIDKKPAPPSDLQLAHLLFNSYNEQGPNPWKAHNGQPVPPFSACGEQVQAKWLAVARAARRAFG